MMIPEDEGSTSQRCQPQEEMGEQDEVMLAGYKECAKEALTWLMNLGYEPGHPLIRSLAAHLTKKQAYLEKMNLENFLIEKTFKESKEEEGSYVDEEENLNAFEYLANQIRNNKEIQKALVEAVFRGCDLQYKTN